MSVVNNSYKLRIIEWTGSSLDTKETELGKFTVTRPFLPLWLRRWDMGHITNVYTAVNYRLFNVPAVGVLPTPACEQKVVQAGAIANQILTHAGNIDYSDIELPEGTYQVSQIGNALAPYLTGSSTATRWAFYILEKIGN